MRKIIILCENFYDRTKMERLNVGGIEVYVYSLLPVLISKGLYPIVVQFANVDKIIKFDGYEFHHRIDGLEVLRRN